MRLLGSKTSPFVRKVRVVAAELGLTDRIAFEELDPHAGPPALGGVNPLHKVPVLVTDDGTVLHDSPVIAEYLDATFGAGGHARLLADDLGGRGKLVAIDRDPAARPYFDRFKAAGMHVVRSTDPIETWADLKL